VRRLSLLLICLCAMTQAQADTRYVTDQCSVPMRKGEGLKYKVTRMLPSGTTLQVTGGGSNSGYTQARTPEGSVGFVATADLMAEPAARDRLAEMAAKLAELQQAPDALTTRLAAAQSEQQDLKASYARVSADRDRLEQELATLRSASANIVEVTNDRAELRTRVAELTRQTADLEQKARDLSLENDQRWFLIGGGVVVAGILIGLILPSLRFRRRKSSWGSL